MDKSDKKATKRTKKIPAKKPATKNPAKKQETIKDRQDVLKAKLIAAMIRTSGNIFKSCKAVKCARQTFYDYRDHDPQFKEVIDEIDENELDTVEDALQKQIKGGNIVGIIFYLKTKGKKRGYSEEIININKNIDFSNMSTKDIDELLKKHDS